MIASQAAAETSPLRVKRHARDAARVVAFGLGSERALPDPTEVAALYRWGWLPLIVGCAFIAAVVIILSEIVLARLGYEEPDPARRALFIARAAITSGALAVWAGWYVLRTRRRLEAAREALLLRRNELEARAVRAEQVAGLGAFSRILAHEVRNPLNTIAIHCSLLERRAKEIDGAAEPLRSIIDVLEGETQRLKRLVDDYIAYGRHGQIELHPGRVRLESIARTVVEADRLALDERGVAAVVEAPEGLPPVRADEERIAEAIHLLLCRARESSPRGGTVRVRLSSDASAVSLSVHHEGRPFADPMAVFRPFYTGGDPAAGFGRAIVRDIVRAHGGEIHASNEPGGAYVRLRIPKAEP